LAAGTGAATTGILLQQEKGQEKGTLPFSRYLSFSSGIIKTQEKGSVPIFANMGP